MLKFLSLSGDHLADIRRCTGIAGVASVGQGSRRCQHNFLFDRVPPFSWKPRAVARLFRSPDGLVAAKTR
jgi:hypothetical protein